MSLKPGCGNLSFYLTLELTTEQQGGAAMSGYPREGLHTTSHDDHSVLAAGWGKTGSHLPPNLHRNKSAEPGPHEK